MSYIPDFSRNPKGKFNPYLNFITLKGASDAYVIEDEWNEMQWIQSEERAKLVRAMTHSGCLQISTNPNSTEAGAIKAHLDLIRDDQGTVLQYADIISSVHELNNFVINPFDAVLNGYLVRIESTAVQGLTLQLDEPYATSTNRQDFAILEFWFKEVRPHDKVPMFGGVENDPVPFEMLDHRISIPTTDRVQLQWRLRVISDDRNEVIPHYDNGTNRVEYLNIHPQGPRPYENSEFIFKTADFAPYNDPYLFIAGNGLNSAIQLDTIDGFVYAIPLFQITRLNIAGYNPYNNVNGGILWKNADSVSDRVSLDGKFANVIYVDDIIDQRHQAYIGTKELDNRYTELIDFNAFKKTTNNKINLNVNNINTLIDENNNLRKEIEFLTLLAI